MCMNNILNPKNVVQPVIHRMRLSSPKTDHQVPVRDLNNDFLENQSSLETGYIDWGTQSVFRNPKFDTEMTEHDGFR